MPARRTTTGKVVEAPKLPGTRSSSGAKKQAKKIVPLKRAARDPQKKTAVPKKQAAKMTPLKRALRGSQNNGTKPEKKVREDGRVDPIKPMTIELRAAADRAPTLKPIPVRTAQRITEMEKTIETLTINFAQSERLGQRVMKAEDAPQHFAAAVKTAQQIQDLYRELKETYDRIKYTVKANEAFDEEEKWYGVKRNMLVLLTEMKARITRF